MADEPNRKARPSGVAHRRRLVRGETIGTGTIWAAPVVESFTSPSAEPSTTALVGIGSAVSGRGISPKPPAQGSFRVLLAASQDALSLQLSSGWTRFLANEGSMSLSGWYGGSTASTPTFIAPGATTAVILGFSGSSTVEAGIVTDDSERTITGAAIEASGGGGVVLFLGGAASPRPWTTPSGHLTRVSSPVPDASTEDSTQLLVWEREGGPTQSAGTTSSITTGPDVVTSGVQLIVR